MAISGFSGGHYVAGVATVGHYRQLCTSPCTMSLRNGSYQLALSQNGGPPISASSPVRIAGPSRVQGTYTSRHGLRVAGVVTIVGGATIGLVVTLTSFYTTEPDCTPAIRLLAWP